MKEEYGLVWNHTGAFIERSSRDVATPMAAATGGSEDTHRVPMGTRWTDQQLADAAKMFKEKMVPFELLRTGKKVTQLSIWTVRPPGKHGHTLTEGVQVTFQDQTKMQTGLNSNKSGMLSSIDLHPDEMIRNTTISVLEYIPRLNIEVCGGLTLETDFGQKLSAKFFLLDKIRDRVRNVSDATTGSLIGVYGLGWSGGLLSLSLILAPPTDVEYEFENIEYDLSECKRVGDRMLSLKEQIIKNDSPATVTMNVKFSHSHSTTKNWSSTTGLRVGVKTNVRAQFPFIVDGKIEMSAESSFAYGWGGGFSETTTDEWTASITAPPNSHLRGMATVTELTIDVPYSANVIVRRSDGSSKRIPNLVGVYRGVNISHFSIEVEPLDE